MKTDETRFRENAARLARRQRLVKLVSVSFLIIFGLLVIYLEREVIGGVLGQSAGLFSSVFHETPPKDSTGPDHGHLLHNNPNVEIAVRSSPSGALLEFQGQVWGRTPRKLTVPRGRKVSIRLSHPGYVTHESQVAFDASADLNIELKRLK